MGQDVDMRISWPEKKSMVEFVREFVLIVAGVLLALYIGTWQANRQSEAFQIETLLDIANGLQRDIQQVDSRLNRLDSIDLAMQRLANDYKNAEFRIDSADDFSKLSWAITFEPHTAAYESLKSVGLDRIEDAELRRRINHLFDYDYPRFLWMLDESFNHHSKGESYETVSQHIIREASQEPAWQIVDPVNSLKAKQLESLIYRKMDKIRILKGRLESLKTTIHEVEKFLAEFLET